jgi:hypothetical protein
MLPIVELLYLPVTIAKSFPKPEKAGQMTMLNRSMPALDPLTL